MRYVHKRARLNLQPLPLTLASDNMNSRILFLFALALALSLHTGARAAPAHSLHARQVGASSPHALEVASRQGNIVDEVNHEVNKQIDNVQRVTGLSRGAVIGIAIGAVALVVILLLSCCCCLCGMCRK